MRVLLVSANFRPSVGGIERFTEVLGTGLAQRGHEVTVLCCRKDHAPRHETSDGTEVVRLPATYVLHRLFNVPYPVPAPWSLTGTIRRLLGAADVVHVQDALYATSVATLVAARRRAVPSVLTQHVAFVPQQNVVLDTAQRAAIATLGRCARLATTVATLNPAISSWVTETWNVSAEVLPVGMPSADVDIDVRAVRRSFDLPEDRFLVLFVGRDVPKKGLDHVLDAQDEAYDIVAVTDRPRGGERRARLLPFMSQERLRELFAAVDAFVLPSVGEGFPIVLQEALGVGLPVVTTSGEGYERYLTADDVLFVSPTGASVKRALRRLVSDPPLRERLSTRGRAVAEREFGVDRFVDAYEQLYGRVLR